MLPSTMRLPRYPSSSAESAKPIARLEDFGRTPGSQPGSVTLAQSIHRKLRSRSGAAENERAMNPHRNAPSSKHAMLSPMEKKCCFCKFIEQTGFVVEYHWFVRLAFRVPPYPYRLLFSFLFLLSSFFFLLATFAAETGLCRLSSQMPTRRD